MSNVPQDELAKPTALSLLDKVQTFVGHPVTKVGTAIALAVTYVEFPGVFSELLGILFIAWIIYSMFFADSEEDASEVTEDEELTDEWTKIEPLPVEIRDPCARAFQAQKSIGQLAADDAWQRADVDTNDSVDAGRDQLMALLERGQQLGKVAATLERVRREESLPAHYQPVADAYKLHCSKLCDAAEVFEKAEAAFSRALLAVSDSSLTTVAREAPLREMGASFEAPAGALESMRALPAVPVASR